MRNYRLFFVFLFFNLILNPYRLQLADAQEEVTITTYYPSPSGIYNELTSNSMKIGATYSAADIPFDNNGLLVEGRVGIGTTSPMAALHVAGNTVITERLSFRLHPPLYSMVMDPNSDSTDPLQIYRVTDGYDNSTLMIRIGDNAASNPGPTGNGDRFIIGASDSLSGQFYDRVTVTGKGNVGIGTTTPELKLDTRGSYAKATTAAFANIFQAASTDSSSPLTLRMGIKTDATAGNRYGALEVDDAGTKRSLLLQPSGGNVGIGTTNPMTKLQVGNPGNALFLKDSSSWSGGNGASILFGADYDGVNYNKATAAIDAGWVGGNNPTLEMRVTRDWGNPGYKGASISLNYTGWIALNATAVGTNGTFYFMQPVGTISTQGGGSQRIDFLNGGGGTAFQFWTDSGIGRASNSWGTPLLDLAENYDISDKSESGTVLTFDPKKDNVLKKTENKYQIILGVVSSAPGFILGSPMNENSLSPKGKRAVALKGMVPCKVSAENGMIKMGDILVSASKPGFAMKVDDDKRLTINDRFVVGIALENMKDKEDVINIQR